MSSGTMTDTVSPDHTRHIKGARKNGYTSLSSVYRIFWRKQRYRDGSQVGGCRGEEGEMGGQESTGASFFCAGL